MKFFYQREVSQGIISNGREDDIRNKLLKWKLDKYIQTIASADLDLLLKPHVDMLQYSIRQLGININIDDVFLFIGDTETDELMTRHARAQGINCIYVDIARDMNKLLDMLVELK